MLFESLGDKEKLSSNWKDFLLLLWFQIKNNFKCVGLGKEGLGMKKDEARSQKG